MKWLEALKRAGKPGGPNSRRAKQRLVAIAAALVGLALVWWVALAPALRHLVRGSGRARRSSMRSCSR